METAHMEHVLDHTKPNDFMDTSNNYFDTISNLDYLQYPHSPGFGVSMGREYALPPSPIDPVIEANTITHSPAVLSPHRVQLFEPQQRDE